MGVRTMTGSTHSTNRHEHILEIRAIDGLVILGLVSLGKHKLDLLKQLHLELAARAARLCVCVCACLCVCV